MDSLKFFIKIEKWQNIDKCLVLIPFDFIKRWNCGDQNFQNTCFASISGVNIIKYNFLGFASDIAYNQGSLENVVYYWFCFLILFENSDTECVNNLLLLHPNNFFLKILSIQEKTCMFMEYIQISFSGVMVNWWGNVFIGLILWNALVFHLIILP